MGSLMKNAPTLYKMSEVEEAVTTTSSRHEHSSSEVATPGTGTDFSERGLTVSPNSVSLASYDEAIVTTRVHKRSNSPSNTELPAPTITLELKQAHDKIVSLQKVIADKDRLLKKRKRELSGAKEKLVKVTDAERHKQDDTDSIKEELKNAKAKLVESEASKDELSRMLRILKSDLNEANSEIVHLEETVEAKQRINDKKEREYRSLRDDFHAASKDYQDRIAAAAAKIKDLKAENEEIRRQKDILEKRKTLSKSASPENCESIKERCYGIENELRSNYESKLKRKEDLIKLKEGEMQELEKKVETMKFQLQKEVAAKEELLDRLQKAEQEQQQVVKANVELKQVVQAMQMRIVKASIFQGEKEAPNPSVDSTIESDDELEDLKEEQRRLEGALRRKEAELRRKEDRNRKIEFEMKEISQKLKFERMKLEAEREAKAEAERRLVSETRSAKELSAKLDQTLEDLKKSESEVELLRKRVSDLTETLSCHRSESARLTREASEAKGRAAKLELMLEERETNKRRLEEEIKKLQSGLGEAGEEMEDLRKKCELDLKVAKEGYDAHIKSCEEEMLLLKSKIEEITAKGLRERKVLQEALAEVECELDLAGHINRHLVEQRDEALGRVREYRENESEMSATLERSLCKQSWTRSSYLTFKSRCRQLEEDLNRAEEMRFRAEADLMAALTTKYRKGI